MTRNVMISEEYSAIRGTRYEPGCLMININLNFIILRHTQQKPDHIIISCRYFMIEVVWDTYDIAKFTGAVPRLPVAVNVCDILYHGISIMSRTILCTYRIPKIEYRVCC